jgi:hypothetical protein
LLLGFLLPTQFLELIGPLVLSEMTSLAVTPLRV